MLCLNFKGATWRKWADGVCVVYDAVGESGSQVVPQPSMLSHTQFLRVCLYMTTSDLSLWQMSEIAPLHLWCISRGQDLRRTHKHTRRLREAGEVNLAPPGYTHQPRRLHPHKEDDKLHASRRVYIPPCSKRLPQAPARACSRGTHLNTLIK